MSTYNINFTDPLKNTFSIPSGGYNGPGGVQSNSTLRLYGRGALEWGESVDEDLLRLTENFCSATFPLSPNNGQLFSYIELYWHNTDNNTWFVYDPNTADGEPAVWNPITVTDSFVGFPSLQPEGTYVYRSDLSQLFGYYTMYGQSAIDWRVRGHRSAEVDPTSTDYPRQFTYKYNAHIDDASKAWQLLNTTWENEVAPSNPTGGLSWFDPTTDILKIWNSITETWQQVGGNTSDIDMSGTYNITNLPLQCTGSPIGSNLDPQNAASIGYVECYVAEQFASFDGSMAGYLPLTGGTLTGPLVLNSAPTVDLQAATKKYVDDKIASVGYLPVGTVIALPFSGTVPGYLKMNGSSYDKATYPEFWQFMVGDRTYPLVTGVSLAGATGLVTTAAPHNLSQNSCIRFASINTGNVPNDNTTLITDYYVEYVSASTFYLMSYPDGPRVNRGTATGATFRQSLFGFGATAAGLITTLANATHGTLPDARGAFIRGFADGASIDQTLAEDNVTIIYNRQLGTMQKPSLLMGDLQANTVNNFARCGKNRRYLGWDATEVTNYHNTANPPTLVPGTGSTAVGASGMSNGHTGGARPLNITLTYYIKAYDTDNATSASMDVAALEARVTAIENINATQLISTKSALTPQTYTNVTSYTFPHSLGDYPTQVIMYAQCITADGAFAPGKRINLNSYAFVGVNHYGITVSYTPTEVIITVGAGNKIHAFDPSWIDLTHGRWSLSGVVYGETP